MSLNYGFITAALKHVMGLQSTSQSAHLKMIPTFFVVIFLAGLCTQDGSPQLPRETWLADGCSAYEAKPEIPKT